MKRADRRGVALVFVLWLLVLLGAIVTELASRARSEADILASLRARTAARYAAESGVLATRARIEAVLDSTPGSAERITALHNLGSRLGDMSDVSLGTARFGVAVVDLNARLDVNRAVPAALEGLFHQFTTDQRAAEAVAALKAVPVYRLGELAHLPSIGDSLALAVVPYLTVWSDGLVNINTAPEPVLAAVPGLSRAVARNIVRRREAGEVFQTPDVAGASALPLTVTPTRLLIVSRGWQEGHPLTHEIQAVYAVLGDRLALAAWQEQDR